MTGTLTLDISKTLYISTSLKLLYKSFSLAIPKYFKLLLLENLGLLPKRLIY